ncbi:SRPBCC family protein [Epilithonimonas mollis]|uniref:Polyketide cyclase / dehydrase and lipid transport n=1 Tax=Epilithonimonas mollis TaxID=216903 RepID=A0A1M6PEA9_9FLAO|nr:SRPBCC family protein [Epilithonimonas mollis]SHK06295.1 Polyketide cyclase / dehydrase and lipid transport [Epilithonimonas mollis]
MKKFLKIISVIVAIIIAYCLIAILFFDSKCHNEQSIVINAPKEKVWQNVNSMKAFNTWNPWMKMDPNLSVTYRGNSGDVGDGYHWKGNDDVGEGEQEITAIVPHEKVETKMHFIQPMDDNATSDLILVPEGSGTKVTWNIDYEIETLFKPMKPMMTWQMNKSFSEGLGKLKALSEK